MAVALVLMYTWVNVFSSTVSATLLYIPLTAPRDSPPPTPPAAGSADVTSIDKNVGVEMALWV